MEYVEKDRKQNEQHQPHGVNDRFYFPRDGLSEYHSISVNTIREPSSAGIGKRFITAKFAEITAIT